MCLTIVVFHLFFLHLFDRPPIHSTIHPVTYPFISPFTHPSIQSLLIKAHKKFHCLSCTLGLKLRQNLIISWFNFLAWYLFSFIYVLITCVFFFWQSSIIIAFCSKIFRETKESELRNLLKAKQDLEIKLARLGGSAFEDAETTSRLENSGGASKTLSLSFIPCSFHVAVHKE